MKKLPALVAVALLGVASSSVAADLSAGESVYKQACFACHGIGAAGAPKIGDKAAWAPRVKKGMETLVKHAIHGFQGDSGVMPPKGGRTDLSDEQVTNAVAYLVSQAK